MWREQWCNINWKKITKENVVRNVKISTYQYVQYLFRPSKWKIRSKCQRDFLLKLVIQKWQHGRRNLSSKFNLLFFCLYWQQSVVENELLTRRTKKKRKRKLIYIEVSRIILLFFSSSKNPIGLYSKSFKYDTRETINTWFSPMQKKLNWKGLSFEEWSMLFHNMLGIHCRF